MDVFVCMRKKDIPDATIRQDYMINAKNCATELLLMLSMKVHINKI